MSVPLGTLTLVMTVISGSKWCLLLLDRCTLATGTACKDSSFGMSTHVSMALRMDGPRKLIMPLYTCPCTVRVVRRKITLRTGYYIRLTHFAYRGTRRGIFGQSNINNCPMTFRLVVPNTQCNYPSLPNNIFKIRLCNNNDDINKFCGRPQRVL